MAERDWTFERIIRYAEDCEQARLRAFRRRLSPRETMATLLFGTGSVTLGIGMLIVTLLGLLGISFQPWSEPRIVMVEATPRQFTSRFDPKTKNYVTEAVLVSVGRVFVPSPDCVLPQLMGYVLGGIGLAVSLRRRKFSWLSAIGVTLMLLSMMIVVACGTLMRLEP